MQTVRKKISDLHKTPKNIRLHSDRQIEEYIRSLKMFGQIRPLVVTDDGEILVGNGMYEAFLRMGETECDAYVVSGLSESQKKKLMLADNKVYDLGMNDTVMLDDILGDLNGDFDVPGYNMDLLETLYLTSVEEAGDVVKDYGREIAVSSEPKEDAHVAYGEVGTTQYAPPVRQADGGFAEPEPVQEQYIVCPHCGEKIWL